MRAIGKAVTAVVATLLMSVAAQADPVELERQGDALYASRGIGTNAQDAIQAYQKALAMDSSRSSAYWKTARGYFWLAMQHNARRQVQTCTGDNYT